MPYDPDLPQENTEIDAAQMRGQLQGLFEAFLAGRITSVAIDAVNTINAGDPASVSAQITGNVLHLTFNIPRGATGTAGIDGTPGGPGPAGPQGPSSANALIGNVTTLNPGENAWVTMMFDGTNVTFFFGIPRRHRRRIGRQAAGARHGHQRHQPEQQQRARAQPDRGCHLQPEPDAESDEQVRRSDQRAAAVAPDGMRH